MLVRSRRLFCFSLHSGNNLLRWVENTTCLGITNVTPCRFLVIVKSTFFTEIMSTPVETNDPLKKYTKQLNLCLNYNVSRTYLVTTGSLKLCLQMKHLKGKLSESSAISYLWGSSSSSP